MLRDIIRVAIPNTIYSFLSTRRKYNHSKRTHNFLCEIGQEIKPELMDNIIIIPNRGVLLDLMPKNGFVAEIGVAEGLYSKQILQQNIPRKLHLIDSWPPRKGHSTNDARQAVEKNFAAKISEGVAKVHQGVSWEVLREFPDSYFDWVYIDAGHDYNSVKKDLNLCKKKVKMGGYICGHDYITWSNALDRFGVVEAVNEFINETASPMVYLTNQRNRHLSYAIKLNK